MDLPSLMSELQLRGFDQEKVDSSLRCLVHVFEVQGYASTETGGILAEDIINTYDLDVVQAATQLFLDKSKSENREVFTVRWGCEEAAKTMERELWNHASERWEEFVTQLDGRYLGFFMPPSDEGARVVTNWRLSRELKWFSVQVQRQGWRMLSMMDDITEVAWKLDIAFGYRPFGPGGIQGPRVLLHLGAYRSLKAKKIPPPDELLQSIRLWKFFSSYEGPKTDIDALAKDCGITVDDVRAQVSRFFNINVTSQYRDGQYPPFFINDKKKKEYQLAVADLLRPMDEWLAHAGPEKQSQPQVESKDQVANQETSPLLSSAQGTASPVQGN